MPGHGPAAHDRFMMGGGVCHRLLCVYLSRERRVCARGGGGGGAAPGIGCMLTPCSLSVCVCICAVPGLPGWPVYQLCR
eukprot:COSAG01_NODE_1596_length_9782_cov_16.488692_2_plen_79_part_00